MLHHQRAGYKNLEETAPNDEENEDRRTICVSEDQLERLGPPRIHKTSY